MVRTALLAWIKNPSETHRDCFRKEFCKIGKVKYNLDTWLANFELARTAWWEDSESRLESNRRKRKTIIVSMLLSLCLTYYFLYTKERLAAHTCKKKNRRKKKRNRDGHGTMTRWTENQRGKNRTCVLCSDPSKIKLKLSKKNKRACKLFNVFILG
jgi:hypothetical protein